MTTTGPISTYREPDYDEKKIRLILDSSGLGTWDWNPLTDEVYFDENWCLQLGLDHKTTPMQLSTWKDRVHPDDLENCLQQIKRHMEGQSSRYELTHRLRHANGNWIWILACGKITSRNQAGQSSRFIGVHADISKQKEKEIEYKQSLETRNAILKSARFAIITTNTDGIITGFNEEAERILGYTAESMIGKANPLLFHDSSEINEVANTFTKGLGLTLSPDFSVLATIAQTENCNDLQWSYLTKDGRRLQIILSITVLHDTRGSINGYLFIAKDITEELATKAIIEEQRAKLLSSSKMAALGEMAAGIAHEVNNPLAIVSGKANLLIQWLDRDGQVDPKKLRDSLEKIVENTYRVAKIIASMKSLSRNAEGDPMDSVSIRTVISDALSLCSEKFKYNQIRLTVDCIHDHNFNGRQSQIAQILTNLLNNSFDAVKDLTDKWVKISVTTTESQLKIEVIDSGKGIAPNIQAKLMQPFFTTKEVGKGTGLGLSISRKIAEEHGGELFFDTKSAHTSFVLLLPLPKP